MASFFERLRENFRKATSSNVAAADRNKFAGRDDPSTRTGRVAQNIMSDLAISFGNTEGVSQAGLDDYNKRTERSKAAMKQFEADKESNERTARQHAREGKATVAAPAAPTTTVADEPVTETPEPPATPVDPVKLAPVGGSTTTAGSAEEEADILEAGATGDAEKDVADTIRKKGRRSTVQTTSKGLLTEAPTRKRRSLMGGGLIA